MKKFLVVALASLLACSAPLYALAMDNIPRYDKNPTQSSGMPADVYKSRQQSQKANIKKMNTSTASNSTANETDIGTGTDPDIGTGTDPDTSGHWSYGNEIGHWTGGSPTGHWSGGSPIGHWEDIDDAAGSDTDTSTGTDHQIFVIDSWSNFSWNDDGWENYAWYDDGWSNFNWKSSGEE